MLGDEKICPLKNMTSLKLSAFPAIPEAATLPRFQIYCQTRTGAYTAEFKTDSVVDAVEAFLQYSPDFEGGELRLWNHEEKCVSASVEWITERTDFGFPVSSRKNVFHHRLLGVIARQLQMREGIREEIQQSVRMSA